MLCYNGVSSVEMQKMKIFRAFEVRAKLQVFSKYSSSVLFMKQ